MRFDFTPEEAQPAAIKLIESLSAKGGRLLVEKAAWPGAPYKTTLVHQLNGMHVLYEAQGQLDFHERLQTFSDWIAARRHFSELIIVSDAEGEVAPRVFRDLSKRGVGLILVEDGKFDLTLKARNPALQVTPEPTLKLGELRDEVDVCVEKFNIVNRKDGLRDMCELVERETEEVLLRGSKKGWITLPEAAIAQKDWSDQINTLASPNVMTGGKPPLIDSKLKDDLHSFRGSRNLMGHKVSSKSAENRRQLQLAERMMMGPRLCSDLHAIKRKIK